MILDILELMLPKLILIMVFWLVALYMWSRKSWWGYYAKRFKLENNKDLVSSTKLYHSGGGGYRGTFRVGVAKEGLIFKSYFAFRPFHPPMFIPWESIEKVDVKSALGPVTKNIFGYLIGLLGTTIYVKGETNNPISIAVHPDLAGIINKASNHAN